MVVLGLISWTGVARLTRGEFFRIGTLDYVSAIRALGGSNWRIIFRHILPNGIGPVLVVASFGIASAILIESALSFLGMGVPQPSASWGTLLNDGRSDIWGAWWLTVFPGFAIFLTVTAWNLFGEGLRDAIDPRLKQ
jgi:peptide/nickel transport system permease protein